MIYCKENEILEKLQDEEEYDYMNEEALKEESVAYEEDEIDYCD